MGNHAFVNGTCSMEYEIMIETRDGVEKRRI